MSKAKQLITIRDLAKKYSKDPSYIAKMVKEYKLKIVPAIQDKHACQALEMAEVEKLEKNNPLLTYPLIGKDEKELKVVAKERKQDVSGLLKFLRAHEFSLEKRLLAEGGRPVNILPAKEYARLTKDYPARKKIK